MHTSSSAFLPAPLANPVASSTKSLNQLLSALWSPPLLLLSFLAIVFLTLFPFNFTVPHGMTLRQAAAPFDWRLYDPSDPFDSINNIIMFGPFGFALACLARGRKLRTVWLVPFATLVCCLFSSSIEFLQQWLPTRISALSDICSNTTGGFVGAIVFLVIGTPLLRSLTKVLIATLNHLTLPIFAVGFLLLLAVALRSPLHMRHVHRNLSSWSPAFPLAVGNDPRDDRSWRGTVTSVDIADTALVPSQVPAAVASEDLQTVLGDSLLASYRIQASRNSSDLTHHSPDLQWIGPDVPQGTTGALPAVSGDHWLRSTGPMQLVCSRIRETSQFTVRCRFRSDLPSQSPELGRILTLSSDPLHCNLTIGQQRSDLVVRLRTPFSGDNGTNPASKIPDFFLQAGWHDLLLTYDDPVLRFYVDGPQLTGAVEIPADFANVARYLARAMTLPISGYLPEMYRSAFFVISFGPLGLLVALLSAAPGVPPLRRNVALAAGAILPTLVMQLMLVLLCHRPFRTDNLVLGMCATIIVAIPAAVWLKRVAHTKLAE
jgi:VanZ family protein